MNPGTRSIVPETPRNNRNNTNSFWIFPFLRLHRGPKLPPLGAYARNFYLAASQGLYDSKRPLTVYNSTPVRPDERLAESITAALRDGLPPRKIIKAVKMACTLAAKEPNPQVRAGILSILSGHAQIGNPT